MQYRIDKRSGNKLSILGCGSIRFPKKFNALADLEKTEPIIMRAYEGGVNYFDTGYFYLGAEDVIGQVCERNHIRKNVFLATKLPLSLTNKPDDFDKYFDKQLKRFRTDYIDYYLIHMMPDLDSWKQLVSWGIEDWIAGKKKNGQIREMGFSFHGKREEFTALLDAYDWDFAQIQFNYSDENFQAGINGLQYGASKGLAMMIMEPLLGGKLAGGLPPKAREVFRDTAKTGGPDQSPAAWGMNWVWNHPEVTVCLSGFNKLSDVVENLKTADQARPNMLTPGDLEVYKKAQESLRSSFKIPCTGCGYCTPCPQGVNIPGCFAAYNQSYTYGLVQGLWSYVTSNVAAGSKSLGGVWQCKKCGLCEKKCSQRLPIMKFLQDVKKRLDPWWFRGILNFFGQLFLLLKRNHATAA
jgi:predicted aldo/keto reductase-like oxidoreductase